MYSINKIDFDSPQMHGFSWRDRRHAITLFYVGIKYMKVNMHTYDFCYIQIS